MATFEQIQKATRFTSQDPFSTPDEVHEYFTAANLAKCGLGPIHQDILDEYAREVIAHGWNMAPYCVTVVNGAGMSYGGQLAEIWHWLQGFRSNLPCTLVQQTAQPHPLDLGHKPGTRICTGTVRQAMDWIDATITTERHAV